MGYSVDIPQLDGAVPVPSGQGPAIAAERYGGDLGNVALVCVDFGINDSRPLFRKRPELNVAIGAGGRQTRAIGVERQGIDASRVPYKGGLELARGCFPELDRPVHAARR